MDRILEGVAKFQRDVYPPQRELFEQLANRQSPRALFITCADSRVVPDLITQVGPGELFICRNAGNMIPSHGEVNGGVSATIEYAVVALKIRHIIVCGHTDCGAMKGVLHPETTDSMPTVKSWLAYGEMARRVVEQAYPDLTDEAKLHALIGENVVAQLDHLKTHPSVAASLATGNLCIHGWVYHIRSGVVEAWDAQVGQFVPIEEYNPESATPKPRVHRFAEVAR
ncbi:MAG: carbonic anhydrase [Bryobacteraceae bacterium]|nr:carbonic anhydrase [Bryobacteraceae bacterium]